MNHVTQTKMGALKRAFGDARAIVEGFRATVRGIDTRWDLDPETKRKGRELARHQALGQLADLRAQSERLSAELKGELESQANKPPRIGQTEAVHAEGLRGRLRRAESINAEAFMIAKEAASQNDIARLSALRAILPDVAAERKTPVDHELSTFLQFSTGDSDVREAMLALGELSRGSYRLNVALGLAEQDLKSGRFDQPGYTTVWPNWSPNEEIKV